MNVFMAIYAPPPDHVFCLSPSIASRSPRMQCAQNLSFCRLRSNIVVISKKSICGRQFQNFRRGRPLQGGYIPQLPRDNIGAGTTLLDVVAERLHFFPGR